MPQPDHGDFMDYSSKDKNLCLITTTHLHHLPSLLGKNRQGWQNHTLFSCVDSGPLVSGREKSLGEQQTEHILHLDQTDLGLLYKNEVPVWSYLIFQEAPKIWVFMFYFLILTYTIWLSLWIWNAAQVKQNPFPLWVWLAKSKNQPLHLTEWWPVGFKLRGSTGKRRPFLAPGMCCDHIC